MNEEEKKKKGKREAGKITDRDRKLFQFSHEQRYLTLAQIARVFWPETRNIYKRPLTRVNQLMASGFLRAEKVRIGEPTLYLLTRKGLKYLKAENLASGLSLVEDMDWDNYEHDLWVTEVRILFEKKLKFQWTPERILKKRSEKRKVPDGIARKDSHLFLIEVERSEKSRERYETLFFEQSRQTSEGIILYIVKDQRMMAHLRKQAQGWPRIYFTTIEELKGREEWALFLNAHGEELVLGELLDLEDGDWDESLDEFREADQEYHKFQEEAKGKDEFNEGGAKHEETQT